MSWETVLPETVKAASTPIAKLIEVVSAGCGKLYEPTHIKRIAKAEAAALLTAAASQEEVTDLQLRAVSRRLQVEERRQNNIEEIVKQAAVELSQDDQVSPQPVNPDWSARFFSECEDVCDEDMRAVWGKILAGEVKRPQSFSHRTLSILKNLSANEAQLFNIVCKYSFRSVGGGLIFPFDSEWSRDWWAGKGLSFVNVQSLISAGLLAHHSIGLTLKKTEQVFFIGSDSSVSIKSTTPEDFPVGNNSLTPAGVELSRICEWDTEERIGLFLENINPPFSAVRIKVTRMEGDILHYREVT